MISLPTLLIYSFKPIINKRQINIDTLEKPKMDSINYLLALFKKLRKDELIKLLVVFLYSVNSLSGNPIFFCDFGDACTFL